MRGRDPHESGRVASNLELLFDLTFVVAFGIAGNEFPHMAAEGEILLASAGYVFVLFSVIWPWVNYTWFASAFDTDDWAYRLVTMVIMCGVVVLALGIPPFFDSLHHGHVDNTVMVMGYVVMRIGMALHWGGPICKRRSSEPGRESTLRPCWRRRSVG
nr:low temperature requirement protein A [Kocuria sp. JC486]